ncbi:MAG: carbohydrate porin [Azospirillaceae bacterium]|nr:carbohydrate porin [Azospirillaceae bacterium]
MINNNEKQRPIGLALLTGIAALMVPVAASAQTATTTASPMAPLAGASLAPYYNDLVNDGIYLSGRYNGEFATNPSGGIRNGALFTGELSLGAVFDMDKLAGISGGALHVTATDRAGNNLAARDIGNSISVQQIYGQGQTYKLTEFYWDQALFGDHLEIQAGRLAAASGFADASPFNCYFQTNSVCGNPSIFGFDNQVSYWASGVWGGQVTVKPTPDLYAKFGAFAQDPNQANSNYHGFNWGENRGIDGADITTELGYTTSFDSDAYPRDFAVGAVFDTAPYSDPYYDTSGNSAVLSGKPYQTHAGRTTVYGRFDQMIWRPDPQDTRGLYAFGTVALPTDGNQPMDLYLQAGLLDKGPFASRPLDTVGFVVTDSQWSDAALHYVRDSRRSVGGSGMPDANEVMMEVNYGAQVSPWLNIMPNLQYIINPDQMNEPTRLTNIPDTFVIGVQFVIGIPELLGATTQTYHHTAGSSL